MRNFFFNFYVIYLFGGDFNEFADGKVLEYIVDQVHRGVDTERGHSVLHARDRDCLHIGLQVGFPLIQLQQQHKIPLIKFTDCGGFHHGQGY